MLGCTLDLVSWVLDLVVYPEFGELGHGSGDTYLNLVSWVMDLGVSI